MKLACFIKLLVYQRLSSLRQLFNWTSIELTKCPINKKPNYGLSSFLSLNYCNYRIKQLMNINNLCLNCRMLRNADETSITFKFFTIRSFSPRKIFISVQTLSGKLKTFFSTITVLTKSLCLQDIKRTKKETVTNMTRT